MSDALRSPLPNKTNSQSSCQNHHCPLSVDGFGETSPMCVKMGNGHKGGSWELKKGLHQGPTEGPAPKMTLDASTHITGVGLRREPSASAARVRTPCGHLLQEHEPSHMELTKQRLMVPLFWRLKTSLQAWAGRVILRLSPGVWMAVLLLCPPWSSL